MKVIGLNLTTYIQIKEFSGKFFYFMREKIMKIENFHYFVRTDFHMYLLLEIINSSEENRLNIFIYSNIDYFHIFKCIISIFKYLNKH